MNNNQLDFDFPILFIADAEYTAEQCYIDEWVEALLPSAYKHPTKVVFLPLSKESAPLNLLHLKQALDAEDQTQLVPIRVTWPAELSGGKWFALKRFIVGGRSRPGRFQTKKIIQNSKDSLSCLIADSATIGDLKVRFNQEFEGDQFAKFVARQAGLSLDLAARRLPGEVFKVPRFVAASIQGGQKYQQALEKLADELGEPVSNLAKEGQIYFKELVSVPNSLSVGSRAWFDKYILSLGYEEDVAYSTEDIERLREIVCNHPTLILWTHKIYYDGSVVTSTLHKHKFPLLHMFGGINMNFLGLGYLLRHSGAIFIRRTFQDNKLYKLVLRQYISYLMEKRFPLSWSFEGTRSRLGKLMPPRFGLMKYVLEAASEAGIEDIHIIPISVSYDYMRDVEDYAEEQAGKIKKPESLKWFLGYLSSLRRPMGRIYLDIADPVVLKEAPEPGDKLALSKTAFEVAVGVNKVTPITLTSLTCLILLGAAPRALTTAELKSKSTKLTQWAKARGIRMSSDFDAENIDHMYKVADIMVDRGLLVRYDEGPDRVYGIAPEKHALASYYRNMIVHHFLNKAIIELALFKAGEVPASEALAVFWAETEELRNLFKFEFFYPASKEFRNDINAELQRVDADWEEAVVVGRKAIRVLLAKMQPFVAHAVLQPFVESYSVMTGIVAKMSIDEEPNEDEYVSQAVSVARQAYLQRRITSEASIATLLFSNAYKLMSNMELLVSGDETVLEQRLRLNKKFRELANRLERIRVEAQHQ